MNVKVYGWCIFKRLQNAQNLCRTRSLFPVIALSVCHKSSLHSSNPYEVLGLDNSASQKQIRAAFIKLSKELHPDLNKNDKESQENFKKVLDAYKKINSKEKMRRFDQNFQAGRTYKAFHDDANEETDSYYTYEDGGPVEAAPRSRMEKMRKKKPSQEENQYWAAYHQEREDNYRLHFQENERKPMSPEAKRLFEKFYAYMYYVVICGVVIANLTILYYEIKSRFR